MTKLTKRLLIATAVLATTLSLTGCATTSQTTASSKQVTSVTDSEFFSMNAIHDIDVEFDDAAYQTMLTEYTNSGEKTWMKATVTIDGTTFENVGIKLKGNSTLRGLTKSSEKISPTTETETAAATATTNVPTGEPSSLDSTSPETLPWVIRLDKYEKGVAYDGRSYFVVRANNTETSLNEAVALAVLNEAGVEAEQAAFTRFSVNNSEQKVRLVIDVPDDDLWTEEHFDSSGLLYKADGNGDYTYRGTDSASYTDVFEQKSGDDDLTPLISFLDFINNASDEDFASKLTDYLDTDAFATYLAGQKIIQNTDDIDGPGNNSYLYYNTATKKMTVVAWDHNLAFGGMDMGSPGGTRPSKEDEFTDQPDMAGKTPPEGMNTPPDMADGQRPEMPEGQELPDDMNQRNGKTGMGGKENALVTRFLNNAAFKQLYDEKVASLTQNSLEEKADTFLSDYQQLLIDNVSDLIAKDTITSEANSIRNMLTSTPSDETETK